MTHSVSLTSSDERPPGDRYGWACTCGRIEAGYWLDREMALHHARVHAHTHTPPADAPAPLGQLTLLQGGTA